MLNEDGSFYYDNKRLAEEIGVDEKTIKRVKLFLKNEGYINMVNGKFKTIATKYWILRKPDRKSPFVDISKADNLPVKPDKMLSEAGQNVTPNNIRNKEINNKTNFLYSFSNNKEPYNEKLEKRYKELQERGY